MAGEIRNGALGGIQRAIVNIVAGLVLLGIPTLIGFAINQLVRSETTNGRIDLLNARIENVAEAARDEKRAKDEAIAELRRLLGVIDIRVRDLERALR